MKFSANLGYLWTDRPLPEAIRAAKQAGFDAVECHWPYDTPAEAVRAALEETGLPMLSLNTRRGHDAFGRAAVPGLGTAARQDIDEALGYAVAVGAGAVHVLAGNASGDQARAAFLDALAHAADRAEEVSRIILIEPLNRHDAPGYFLRTTDQAVEILRELDRPNVRLMFDCYHVGRTEGAVVDRLRALIGVIGHVQIASVPDRGPPDRGTLDYAEVFAALAELGWERPVGAEYRPDRQPPQDLGWRAALSPG